MSFDEAYQRGIARAEQQLRQAKEVVHLDAYSVLAAALDAYDAGLCPIPAETDGSKKPRGEWEHWQRQRPTRTQIETWFNDYPAMGIVCGEISGGLEMFELEGRAADLLEAFKDKLRQVGVYDEWVRIVSGYAEKSPNDGFHVFWRCEQTSGNLRLAKDANGQVLIETRGEGGFVITAPTNGTAHPSNQPWVRLRGAFETIATISPETRAKILETARSFDQLSDSEPERVKPLGEPGDGGTLPGFTLTHTDVLHNAGFQLHHTDRNGNQHWTRPGKSLKEGSSLTVWADDGRATPWSTSINAPNEFVTGKRLLTPWQLHVALNHNGNFTEAGRQWQQDHPQLAPQQQPQVAPAVLPDDVWTARPVLAQIRQAAHSRQRSADALLHIILARIAAIAPYTLQLPAIVGSPSPLCYFVATIATPGVGKSSANDIGRELLPAPLYVADQLPIGTGEGLAEILFEIVEEIDENGKTTEVKRQSKHNAYVYADEGQVLGQIGNRSGATLLPTLRTIWTGGTYGNTNASADKRRIVPHGSYTFGLVAGFQAHKAAALLDDVDAGTPQRFGWALAIDPTIPDTPPEWPDKLNWTPPAEITGPLNQQHLEVAQSVIQQIRAADLARARGETTTDPLDAHAGLYQLKVAGLLALLDNNRKNITVEDWELAATIKQTSDTVRTNVAVAVAHQAAQDEAARRENYARREVAADEAKEQRRIIDCARKIRDKVHNEPDQCTVSNLRRSLRHWPFEAALEHAKIEGWVTEILEPGQGTDKRVLRPGYNR